MEGSVGPPPMGIATRSLKTVALDPEFLPGMLLLRLQNLASLFEFGFLFMVVLNKFS